MFRSHRFAAPSSCAFVLTLVLCGHASAAPSVLFTPSDLGGGLFRYSLRVDNRGGGEALSGLNVLNGNSLFGLDGSSIIGAPADWSFLPPLPPSIDDLDFFSLQESADVPMGGSLGGFFFVSMLDPSVVRTAGFAVEGIGRVSASQVPLANAQFVPGPSSVLVLGVGAIGVVLRLRRTARDRHGRGHRAT